MCDTSQITSVPVVVKNRTFPLGKFQLKIYTTMSGSEVFKMFLGKASMILVPGQSILGFRQQQAESFANKTTFGVFIFQWERKTRKK